jgi:hypothetical protein
MRWVASGDRADGACRASLACYEVRLDGAALPGVARHRLVAPEVRGGGSVVVCDRGGARLPRYDRSRALHHHGIAARLGRPAVVGAGQVYGWLTVLAELPERTRGGRVFRCLCAWGARPTRGRSTCGMERSAPAAACATRHGPAARRRGCTAGNATGGLSGFTRQGGRAQAAPGSSPVAATPAARPPFAARTSRAATPVRAGCLLEAYRQRGTRARPSAAGSR